MIIESERLLQSTAALLKQQEKIRILKGEHFNIFSILKMERLEVRTHSAFIGELLNPNGSHEKGNIFLSLFFDELKLAHLNLDCCSLHIEHSIGTLDLENKTGGRLDILIKDKYNKTICIENKIGTGDQITQVERYCNYNKPNNKVLYLNLFGTEPDIGSKGILKRGNDFEIITYKKEILNWLERCIKEVSDFPILKGSIKQYIILIKKITNTMEDKEKKELEELMLMYFNESNYITDNFLSLKASIGETVRLSVKTLLEKKLGSDLIIYLGNNTNFQYSQIWIKFKGYEDAKQYFGVESFSYKLDGELDVGIFNSGGIPIDYFHDSTRGETHYWPYYKTLTEFEGFSLNFNNDKTLIKLHKDNDFKNRFVEFIGSEVETFINTHKENLANFLKQQ